MNNRREPGNPALYIRVQGLRRGNTEIKCLIHLPKSIKQPYIAIHPGLSPTPAGPVYVINHAALPDSNTLSHYYDNFTSQNGNAGFTIWLSSYIHFARRKAILSVDTLLRRNSLRQGRDTLSWYPSSVIHNPPNSRPDFKLEIWGTCC